MEPAWIQFESAYKNKVNLVAINVDEKSSAEFKKYGAVMTSPSIPVTYWVDRKGKVLLTQGSQMSAAQLSARTREALAKAK